MLLIHAIDLKGEEEGTHLVQNLQDSVLFVEGEITQLIIVMLSMVTPIFRSKHLLLHSFYASKGILHHRSCLESPQQNGRVERKHQHILNVGRALLYQSKLPASYWLYALLHATFIINRVTSPTLHDKSPYHLLHNKVPDIQSFKVFGSLCYSSTLQAQRSKLLSRARKSVFLGYSIGFKGSVLLDIHSREIHISRHVQYHEHILPYPSNPSSITTTWDYFPSDTWTASNSALVISHNPSTTFIDPEPPFIEPTPPTPPISPLIIRKSTKTINPLSHF